MIIESTAPTRIGLFGGGTDVNPFAKIYGGKVLNMAINIRHKAILAPLEGPEIKIEAMGEERNLTVKTIPNRHQDPKFDLIYEVIRTYKPKSGFLFYDKFDGIQSAGLGSSASAAVSMIGAFNKWANKEEERYKTAEKAYKAEINLGWVSGRQDQYASTFGGMNFFEFDKKVWETRFPNDIADEFSKYCLLVYTGKTRHSADIQKELQWRMKLSWATINALRRMRTLTWDAKEAMEDRDYYKVGCLLDIEWELKKQSNPLSTNDRIDLFYKRALKEGVWGGKVLGAGGEGHMLFVCEPKKKNRIAKALGLPVIDFSIDHNGLETKVSYD